MSRVFVLIGAGGFVLGLILGEYFSSVWPLVWLMVANLIWLSWTRRGFKCLLLLGMVTLGMLRIHQVIRLFDVAAEALIKAEQPLTGLVTRVTERYGRQEIEVMNLGGQGESLRGGGRLTSPDILSIKPGDYLTVECRWTPVLPDQQRRWQSRGVLAECRNPRRVQIDGRGNDWRARLARARGDLVSRVQRQYHHPQSDLLAGILLGVQDTMSSELRQDFRATGTSHIVALSGFNVTIIITILSGTLTAVIGRRLAFWPTLGLVISFVIMTGASASVTRAAVMAVMVMVAQQSGRPIAPSRLLAYTFIIMTAVNPLIVRYDLGFQLSFLATVGLVYLSPGLTVRLGWIPAAADLRGNLSSTLAAMAATEPLLLWTFGRFSIVAPFVNIVVLPFIPLIMAIGTIGLIIPLAVPLADALLRLVLAVITTAGSWSFAQVATPWWVAGGIAGLAAVIGIRLIYEANTKDLAR